MHNQPPFLCFLLLLLRRVRVPLTVAAMAAEECLRATAGTPHDAWEDDDYPINNFRSSFLQNVLLSRLLLLLSLHSVSASSLAGRGCRQRAVPVADTSSCSSGYLYLWLCLCSCCCCYSLDRNSNRSNTVMDPPWKSNWGNC